MKDSRELLSAGASSDIWLVAGLLALLVLSISLAAHWVASSRARRLKIPPATIYLSIGAFTLLAVYAAVLAEWVFVAAQALSLAFAIGVLSWTAGRSADAAGMPRTAPEKEEGSRLPVVAPDSAERKAPPQATKT